MLNVHFYSSALRRSGERNPTLRHWLSVAICAFSLVLLTFLGFQIVHELSTLRSAPTDNVKWTLSQAEVELLVVVDVAAKVNDNDPVALFELRKRFDIFYSRMKTIDQMAAFAGQPSESAMRAALQKVGTIIDRDAALLDGPDATLTEHLAELLASLEGLRPLVRQIELSGVNYYADISDQTRASFSMLLFKTALVAFGLIVALTASVIVLIGQFRISLARADEIRHNSLRYASTINASLDAIIVADSNGRIIDFNPAAERTFGISRTSALGAGLAEMIIRPEDRASFKARISSIVSARTPAVSEPQGPDNQRIEMMALRAGGEVFPVELSLGFATGDNGPIYIAYVRDISERLRTQQELLAARDAALAAAKAKSQFLAVMSHEMRTPLNGVIGILDLLSGSKLSIQNRKYVETAILSSEMLQSHIDDVLDMTHIESGHLHLRRAAFDLVTLVDEVIDVNRHAATLANNQLSCNVNLGCTAIVEDRHRLRQILVNLVGNAVKFTRSGEILIQISEFENDLGRVCLDIRVKDTGEGVSSADQQRIFDDFVTLDPYHRRTSRGYGLGLAICRRIVQAMEGTIGVESTRWQGSEFRVVIPVTFAPAFQTTPSTRPGREAVSAAHRLDQSLRIERPNVLVVEDNEINRFVARNMLMAAGCLVSEAQNGEEAVQRAGSTYFDLILMDISMPVLDGLDATRQIRASQNGASRSTLIVGLTAHALPEEQEMLRQAGMEDCLLKPLRVRQITALLERLQSAEGGFDQARPALQPEPAVRKKQRSVRPLPTGPQQKGNNYIDAEVLGELAIILQPQILNQRIRQFCAELESVEVAFESYLQTENLDDMSRAAHKYSGAAAVFGARQLYDILVTLETECQNENKTGLPDIIHAVQQISARSRASYAQSMAAGRL